MGKLLVLPANVRLDWRVIARYKHSSLFGLLVSNKGKKVLKHRHQIKEQQQKLQQFVKKSFEVVGKSVEKINTDGQGLIQSAAIGVNTSRCPCYKTFYGRKLRLFVIS